MFTSQRSRQIFFTACWPNTCKTRASCGPKSSAASWATASMGWPTTSWFPCWAWGSVHAGRLPAALRREEEAAPGHVGRCEGRPSWGLSGQVAGGVPAAAHRRRPGPGLPARPSGPPTWPPRPGGPGFPIQCARGQGPAADRPRELSAGSLVSGWRLEEQHGWSAAAVPTLFAEASRHLVSPVHLRGGSWCREGLSFAPKARGGTWWSLDRTRSQASGSELLAPETAPAALARHPPPPTSSLQPPPALGPLASPPTRRPGARAEGRERGRGRGRRVDRGSAGGPLLLGWSSQCLQGWGPFFRLAVPSMLMTCIEWWAYEIGSFLMGRLSVLDLSAQAIIYEVATVVYMIPMGLSIAVCFRVGTALGAADTVQAKRSAVSGTLCTVGTSLVVGTLLSLLRNKLGHIFTNDEEVVALVSKVLPLYVVFHLFEAVCCLYGGVLRGTSRQAFGAVVNAVTYYVVGLPLGVVLTFVVGLGITGLWLGMLACVFLAAAAFVTYTACMDWKRAAEEVQKRVGLPPQAAESTAPSLRPGPERAVLSSGNVKQIQDFRGSILFLKEIAGWPRT
ncbi:multidrug and toxin extrusion protein 2 isoform X2 [Monodon monoceros]|uniref:multidrug and toxin extrusion protein 2 isoform X2 n=2 Tax=Monodon monoceros TaxID=40151 RepID=UPI0010F65AD9|nr:multidrug and toxin extrusion protein 2 isoform X2 [Monodon monoceros]